MEVEGEEEVVVEAPGGTAGTPVVALSGHHVELHPVPGDQVHGGDGGVADLAAGTHFQLL